MKAIGVSPRECTQNANTVFLDLPELLYVMFPNHQKNIKKKKKKSKQNTEVKEVMK